jgi:hypothetical protein
MAQKKQTKYGVFEGELFYARVFEDNMDDSEFHEKTNGQFNVVFVPKDSDEVNRMVALGFPEVSMGNKMIKPFDVAGGRVGMKLKRPNVHPSGIEDFGGAPGVTHGTTNKKWDFVEDGALGNGTKAKVKISIYGEGSTASVRLEKIGVIEHVPFEEMATAEDRW